VSYNRLYIIGLEGGDPMSQIPETCPRCGAKRIHASLKQDDKTYFECGHSWVPGTTAHIVAINGPRAGTRFEVTGNRVTIGRHPDCEVCLAEDTSVSRNHAQIVRDGNEFLLLDCGSRNGTFLNDDRLGNQGQQLQDGDNISISGAMFIFRRGA
jgi:hypothetical protein